MKNLLFFSLLIILNMFSTVQAQKVCESPDANEIDLNSISVTKCTIKESKSKRNKNKKSRLISVSVSANKRHLKKRELLKKKEVTAIGATGVSKVSETALNAEITNTISLKNNIENLKNKLSKEEVRKALKFTSVDKIPVFDACKKAEKGEESDCFNNEMMRHISKYFSYPGEAVRQNLQGDVWVRFIIDKSGYVKNIKTLGPDNAEILNNEAARVVLKLPRFKPAKKEGKRTSVKYGFPINFSLEE
ncbi:energy transducer TonB [Tenacibaculum finnmarkense]|uniref:energy transducer TonB n=1 Tax=Tenacibaculum finnmarkense TaxID=2781243 RepID=UPI000AC65E14|nr:energy transducer TonB [Tenacibaculum finnmarkense]MCG8784800.1 energy transducer TonB [Tenacibaculum finnmarkense]